MRIHIADCYGVYMRDEHAEGDFGDDYHLGSPGCIRVLSMRDDVAWLSEGTPG